MQLKWENEVHIGKEKRKQQKRKEESNKENVTPKQRKQRQRETEGRKAYWQKLKVVYYIA